MAPHLTLREQSRQTDTAGGSTPAALLLGVQTLPRTVKTVVAVVLDQVLARLNNRKNQKIHVDQFGMRPTFTKIGALSCWS